MATESEIEQRLITTLTDLKYTYRPDIRDRASLEQNFREKFETLNRVNLSDSEFARLRDEIINADVFASAKRLREPNTFVREDDTALQYTLVNIKDWCKNEYEVINQLRLNTSNSHHRYDVILLINGLPVVQIELKTFETTPRKAIQQIVDYKKDSGNGYTNSLLCFMQLFIVSNGSKTNYFANNNNSHFSFDADEQFLPIYELATPDNKKINDLHQFCEKLLCKCTLGELISRYMVLVASEQKLLVMRPYQIYAVKAIVDCIHENRGNGYIWHTTGSGKTLTSFKASTLLKDHPDIEKCLFVVDRKDLDRQTREEFNKFQEGCVEENTNTETLVRRMLSESYADKVIVTTIQKLGLALDNKNEFKERLEPLRDKRIVFIFDECHRSQFGDNHKAIKTFFPKAQLFGFTGTPIFEDNAIYKQSDGTEGYFVTTEDIFQKELHNYTITNAIEDRNVLPFHIDYFKPDKKVPVDTSAHKNAVVKAILQKHDKATNSRLFNAVFATASINDAIAYYQLFGEQQSKLLSENSNYTPLHIACVFSPPAQLIAKDGDQQSQKNAADIRQLQDDLQQEKEDNRTEPEEKKKALQLIIDNYNAQYQTNHSVADFDRYYQDVQSRIKNQKYKNEDYAHAHKIDVLIVVDMLLTGFDSKFLNTLYVDKNLKYHSLIQAFSRTNRILNASKPYGNILDFRQQQDSVETAISLFSGSAIENPKEIWLVEPAPKVIFDYEKAVASMAGFMTQNNLLCEPAEVYNLKGDTARIEFVKCFKEVQRLRTRLDQYTDLDAAQLERIDTVLPAEQFRSFKSSYIEIAKQLRDKQQQSPKEQPGLEDLDFELVLFASAIIDYDYIMGLIARYTQNAPGKLMMSKQQLYGLLRSTANLMDVSDDMIAYIDTLETGKPLNEKQVREGFVNYMAQKAAATVVRIAHHNLIGAGALQQFVTSILERKIFDAESLSDLFEPLDLGWKERAQREQALMKQLIPLLKKEAKGSEIAGLKAYEKD
ncbi:MAG: type I restriction endonuclease subunit R [Chitinophagales bacterium]